MNLRDKGVTQRQVAERMSVTRSVVGDLENERHDPSLSKYKAYVDACDKKIVIENK